MIDQKPEYRYSIYLNRRNGVFEIWDNATNTYLGETDTFYSAKEFINVLKRADERKEQESSDVRHGRKVREGV